MSIQKRLGVFLSRFVLYIIIIKCSLAMLTHFSQQGISPSADGDHGLCPLDSREGLCPFKTCHL